MKKVYLLLFFICMVSLQNFAYQIPPWSNYVVDQAGVLTSNELLVLNSKLKDYEDSTSNQIGILIIPEYDDQAGDGVLFDFSMSVFTTWKIGQKKTDNGVLILVTKKLTSKNAPGIRIVTGRGVESALPDILCKRIIENMRPIIHQNNYYGAINLSVDEVIKSLAGEYQASHSDETIPLWLIIVIIIVVLIIIFIIIKDPLGITLIDFGSSSSSSSDGGFFGGGGGGDAGGGGAGD